jgi:hypothetical protein
MDKLKFAHLLEDLYTVYNKEHIVHVPELVNLYHESPFNAIGTIFLKYNHPSLAHYDEKKSSDDYKIDLIKRYANGERVFKDVVLGTRAPIESIQTKVEEKIKEEIDGHEKSMKQLWENKLDEFKHAIDSLIDARLKDEDIEYSVVVNSEEGVLLPNKKQLASLGKGSRIVCMTEGGKVIGLTIQDIIYDAVSMPDKVMVSIFLEKG